jgi:hypothetical protein
MNGRQAAQAVHDLCIERQHNRSPVNPKEFVLCERCRDVMNRLEKIGAEERPPLSTASVHLVLNADGGLYGTSLVEESAHTIARERGGLVVSWPVSADYREGEAS